MSIIRYKCDTCNREVELPQNPRGMEVIKRCTITEGCRGNLKFQALLENFVRGRPTLPSAGLDDWVQRKALVNHTQSVARDQWAIEHNMGVFPSVQVFIDAPTETNPDNQIEIIPDDIQLIDENNINLVFSRNVSGIAQLIARETDPDVFNTAVAVTESSTVPFQVTANTQLTIANLVTKEADPSFTISYQVEYFPPDSISIIIDYVADPTPQIESPWSGEDTVIIKGKVYRVRSFDILIPQMTDGTIGSGSTLHITNVDFNDGNGFVPIIPGDAYLLLSNDPHTNFDKIEEQLIDPTSVTPTDNTFAFGLDQGEIITDPVVINTIYPPIRPTS